MNARDVLEAAEIRELVRVSNFRGAASVLSNWLLIGASLALVGWHPAVWTVVLALVVVGGRQLGLAVLTHEASHRTLLRPLWLNDWVGRWLCGAPGWFSLHRYRLHHLKHHRLTGTPGDPDLGLVTPFPATSASLFRKVIRDLTAVSGLRRVVALLAMDLGFLSYTASLGAERLPPPGSLSALRGAGVHLGPVVLTNGLLFWTLFACGQPWLYAIWVGAYLTTLSLFLRIRSWAEHAGLELSPDVTKNTRTTLANPLARLLIAPHYVNYHFEHHLLMSVPHYRLPRLHRLLRERGVSGPLAAGYGRVLREILPSQV